TVVGRALFLQLRAIAAREQEVRVVGLDGALEDRDRPLVEGGRVVRAPAAARRDAEVVERDRERRARGADRALLRLERRAVGGVGAVEVAARGEDAAEVVPGRGDLVVILAERPLEHGQ